MLTKVAMASWLSLRTSIRLEKERVYHVMYKNVVSCNIWQKGFLAADTSAI